MTKQPCRTMLENIKELFESTGSVAYNKNTAKRILQEQNEFQVMFRVTKDLYVCLAYFKDKKNYELIFCELGIREISRPRRFC